MSEKKNGSKNNLKIFLGVAGGFVLIILLLAVIGSMGGSDSESGISDGTISNIGIENDGAGSSTDIILVNDNCELGATYNMTPEEFVDSFNTTVNVLVGSESPLLLPDISQWTVAEQEEKQSTYMYAMSSELIFYIFTCDDKVTFVELYLSDSLMQEGIGFSYLPLLESATVKIYKQEQISTMSDLFIAKVQEGYSAFSYKNSVLSISGNNIYVSAVSDDILQKMTYYPITDSEIQ